MISVFDNNKSNFIEPVIRAADIVGLVLVLYDMTQQFKEFQDIINIHAPLLRVI